MLSESRKHVLAEEAFKRRLVWVAAGWQAPPPLISKQDVIEYMKSTKPAIEAPQVTALTALRQQAAVVSDFLADLHRDDPDLPVLSLDTAWPSPVVAVSEAATSSAEVPPAVAPSPHALPPFLELLRRHDAADVVDRIRVFVRTFVVRDWRSISAALPDEDAAEYADEEAAEEGAKATSLGGRGDSPSRGVSASSPPLRSAAAELRRFLGELEAYMAEHALWRAEVGTVAWEATLEALEKFVNSKVFSSVFSVHPCAARRDTSLDRRLHSLAFVTFRHLDLPEPPAFLAGGWTMAADALSAMDRYDNPSDKMACILNACRVVSTLLALASDARGGGRDGGVGADEFLPALIYVVLHAHPPRLYSNLRYIGEFCHPNKMNSESGYFYTNVFSAVSFARNVKPEHLSLSRGEFEQEVRSALETAERRGVGRHRPSITPSPSTADQRVEAVSLLDASGLKGSLVATAGAPTDAASGSREAAESAVAPSGTGNDLLAKSRTVLLRLRTAMTDEEAARQRPCQTTVTLQSPPALELPVVHGDSFAADVENGSAVALEAYKAKAAEVVALLQLLLVSLRAAPVRG